MHYYPDYIEARMNCEDNTHSDENTNSDDCVWNY